MSWVTIIPGLRDIIRESDEETIPRSNALSIGDGLVVVYDSVNRRISLAYDADFGANAESIRGNPIASAVSSPGEGTFLSWNAALEQWEATVPPGSGDIAAPIDPTDDGKVGIADGGTLVYTAGTNTGNLLRWNGTTWSGQPTGLLGANEANSVGTGKFLQGAVSGNVAVDDVVVNGQIGWGFASDSGGLTVRGAVQTTNATPVESVVATAPTNAVMVVVSVVKARDTVSGDARIWELKWKVRYDGGTVAGLSSPTVVSDDGDVGSAAWDASLGSGGGGGEDVVVNLTGEAGKTIEWRVTSQFVYALI